MTAQDFLCKALLRLRPIGLALRATLSAPLRWLRVFFFMAHPPLLCEEGNGIPAGTGR